MPRLAHRVWGNIPPNLYIRRDCPSPEITKGASFNKYPLYCDKFTKIRESHRLLCSADRPLVLPSIPAPGWCQYTRPPKASAQQDVWSWCLAPKQLTVPSVWTHVPQLRGLCRRCCCRLCSLVVAALLTSLLPRRRRSCCCLLRCRCFSFAGAVCILGSLGMPFRRGQHLIRVSRPIGSPSRHTPGRMRLSVPGGRIRARMAYLPRGTRPRLHSPLASKHLRAYAPLVL